MSGVKKPWLGLLMSSTSQCPCTKERTGDISRYQVSSVQAAEVMRMRSVSSISPYIDLRDKLCYPSFPSGEKLDYPWILQASSLSVITSPVDYKPADIIHTLYTSAALCRRTLHS